MLQNRPIKRGFASHLHNTLGPLGLIVACPSAAMVIWFTCTYLNGSLLALWELASTQGFLATIDEIWRPYLFGTQTAWVMIILFSAVQLLFMRVMPGKPFYGPVTPRGNVPLYKANGVPSFLATIAFFLLCAYPLGLFSPTVIYDNLGGLIGALNFFSLFFCLFLYFKGRYAPSTTDCGMSGNPLFDYYWGAELYPRLLGWDIKQFTNCRFGMMSWGLIILSFAAKQHALYGITDSVLVAVALQLVYIFKFFCWETGYLRSLDIMHDRAGFYICWGCLVWVPAVYTSPILYLVSNPHTLGVWVSAAILSAGALCIFINYQADRQRQKLRATQGECTIWGRKPEYTVASFVTDKGEEKESLLLLSGWWGVSRHFHYIPEILGAFFWTLPALFSHFLPYFYVLFLTILLFDRARRDDHRCRAKYGSFWTAHCEKVRYKIIPFIY